MSNYFLRLLGLFKRNKPHIPNKLERIRELYLCASKQDNPVNIHDLSLFNGNMYITISNILRKEFPVFSNGVLVVNKKRSQDG